MIKKLVTVLVLLAAGYLGYQQTTPEPADNRPVAASGGQVERAFAERRTSYQVSGKGSVSRVLSDDDEGSRHQRFILRLASGHTVLVAHNIDLAPRVAPLREGDTVSFYGEYEWNERGGVIHWTHHDPKGWHVDGWLEHKGRRYQ